jgi:hypothetical protein
MAIVNAAQNLKSSNFQPNPESFCQAIIFNNNKKKNNKVKSKPLELFELAGKKQYFIKLAVLLDSSRQFQLSS